MHNRWPTGWVLTSLATVLLVSGCGGLAERITAADGQALPTVAGLTEPQRRAAAAATTAATDVRVSAEAFTTATRSAQTGLIESARASASQWWHTKQSVPYPQQPTADLPASTQVQFFETTTRQWLTAAARLNDCRAADRPCHRASAAVAQAMRDFRAAYADIIPAASPTALPDASPQPTESAVELPPIPTGALGSLRQ